MSNTLLIKNCRHYQQPKTPGSDIAIQAGQIKKIGSLPADPGDTGILDAGGRLVAPGFIDIHIQGAGGGDVLDGSREALQKMSQTLARFGVTGFLATTVIDPEQKNRHLQVVRDNWQTDLGGAAILGVHLEGPFINPQKRGGINPRAVQHPDQERLHALLDVTGPSLKMMTLAPELDQALPMIEMLQKNKVIPAFGHSLASYAEAKKGFAAGINHVTHIFNAMPPLHHREPGPLLAIFESETLSAQIISDGAHLHPRIVNYLYQQLGPERCICITDGIQAMGLPDGEYVYNGKKYRAEDGVARYLDGTLIGTAVGVNEIARRFQKFTGCALATAIDTITTNPARLLGLSARKGSVSQGKDADLVLLNADGSVWATIVTGKVVYQQEN